MASSDGLAINVIKLFVDAMTLTIMKLHAMVVAQLAAVSDTRETRFESSRQRLLLNITFILTERIKIKKKRLIKIRFIALIPGFECSSIFLQ